MPVIIPSGFDACSSDFRTNSAVGIPIVREEILELLISSERVLDVHFFDQNKYLENYLKIPGLGPEQDARYFWIFHNLDYEKWIRCRSEAKILGLRGPSAGDMELAASHIVRSLQNHNAASHEGEVLLYFFYNSIRRERSPPGIADWHDMLCVWNLLRTLIKSRSAAEKSILQTFLTNALGFLSDDELANLWDRRNPTDVFKSLLCHLKPQDLWHALGQVLADLKEPEISRKQNLTLIINLNSMASAWDGLDDNISKMTALMPQASWTTRILLSNLPGTSDRCQTQPSMIIEYDKERKGMYSL